MRGFPRHLSQHSDGFVIAAGKLSRLMPIGNAAMENRRVIQWDKGDLESLSLLNVDVLALGILSCIRRTLNLMYESQSLGLGGLSLPKHKTGRKTTSHCSPPACADLSESYALTRCRPAHFDGLK